MLSFKLSLLCPRFIHFALFVSKPINTWRIPMNYIISLLPQYYWMNSRQGKTVSRSENNIGQKEGFLSRYFNGKACKLKLIIFALIVKRCKITWNTLSNSLMVAQHTQKQLRFILRYLKIVHRFCEHTKRLKHSYQCSCVAVQ